jgi:7,8-dihydropterin-6-yl-methyl-4-(beta-D-ribofuranosyl)aminobenzene 5'-phosphate synthase
MPGLRPADRIEVQIIVDNSTDGLSTVQSNVETEFAFATRRRLRASSARCLCCAVHGFSCLITAFRNSERHSILFDSGPEDYAFERNATRLGIDLGVVESIMLSHGHWDHSGAMLLALNAIRARNGAKRIPYFAHPGMFRSRGMTLPNGDVRQMDDVPSVEDLTAHGADVVLTTTRRSFFRTCSTSAAKFRVSRRSNRGCRARCGGPPTARVGSPIP